MNDEKDIVISVICYGNEDEVISFARELSNQKDKEKIILLVTCNKCNNIELLKKELCKVQISSRIFLPEKNLGYLQGCIYGIKEYNNNYKWAIISNTDIEFVSKSFFSEFLQKEYASDIACVGPNIKLKGDIKKQNPFAISRPDRQKMLVRKIAYSNYFFYRIYLELSRFKRNIHKDIQEVKSGVVYAVHGSIFFLKKQCIERLISDNNSLFLYGEELYIAEMIRNEKQYCFYDNTLEVIHNQNQVTRKIGGRNRQRLFKQSIDLLIQKFWQ